MSDDVTVQAQSAFNDVSRGAIFVVSRERALALGKYVRIISDWDEEIVDHTASAVAPVEFGEPELNFAEDSDDGNQGRHLPAED